MGIQGLVYASRLMCCSIRKQAMVTAWFVLVRSIYLLFITEAIVEGISMALRSHQEPIEPAVTTVRTVSHRTVSYHSDSGLRSALSALTGVKYGVLCGSMINIGCSICLLVATVRLDKKCLVWPFMIVSGISLGLIIIAGIVGAALVPFGALTIVILTIIITLEEGFLLFVAVAFYKSVGAGIYGAASDSAILVNNEIVVDGVRLEDNDAIGNARQYSSGDVV